MTTPATSATQASATTDVSRAASRSADAAAALAGAASGAAGLAVAELVAGVIGGSPSLVIAVGDLVIRYQPPGAKDLAVSLFGLNDKLALNLVILAGAVVLAAAIGVVARRRWAWGVGAFAILALVLAAAALQQPLVSPAFALLTPAIAFAVTYRVLHWLLSMIPASPGAAVGSPQAALPGAASTGAASPVTTSAAARMPDWDRRRFLIASGSVAAASVAAGVLGRALLDRQPTVPTSAEPVKLPATAASLPPLQPAASIDVPGITPIVMPNDRFYRIDTALVVPRVDVATWKLTVKGLVEREVTLTYDQLKALGLFEQYVTIACVSNRVGEDLVGNAKWTGAHLRDVLDMAGVRPEATQIVGRSVDGFTVGFPTEWATDPGRDPMVVIGMNDAVLPAEHGYPARLIVPGLFGYVSATKWLAEIELTTWEGFDAYWVPLGWSKTGPILTQSRIDVPRSGSQPKAGPVAVAGVAWAPDRGVAKVEVRVDDGPWQAATLSAPISKATWVQWRYDWAATAGSHRLEVRATDGTGDVQTDQVTPPAPDGARGHHHVDVRVV